MTFLPGKRYLGYYSGPQWRDLDSDLQALKDQGVDVLRLDAVPFLWKKAGTPCENLPEAHLVVRALNAAAAIAARVGQHDQRMMPALRKLLKGPPTPIKLEAARAIVSLSVEKVSMTISPS